MCEERTGQRRNVKTEQKDLESGILMYNICAETDGTMGEQKVRP